MANSDDLTDEQHEQLENEVIDRQPIGCEEILLVGDVRYGIPVLRRYFDGLNGDDVLRLAMKSSVCVLVAKFRSWTRTSCEESLRTLMEVQRLRDLVRQAESAVIEG